MARGRRRSTVSHTWQQVVMIVRCSRGHDVPRGEWVRFTYGGYQRSAICETCMLKHYDIHRPNSTFSFLGNEGDDVKSRQAGGD